MKSWGEYHIEQQADNLAPPRLRYRAEIDGLRALAVFLVVLFHAGFWGAPGGFVGVDVFFVISGYLITSLLLRELEERGTIRLMDFWARRMRRILPAGVLVLCASLVGAAILLPPALESRAAKELPAAALYFINWRLADKAVDYFADNTEPSLFLQYWSLAIEEQFYAVWPLIVILISIVAVRFFRNTALARVLMWTAIAITLMSFGTCLYLTGHNQPYAFFGTFSRAWQLGIGATIALLPLVSINVYARRWMALAGIVAIVFAAVLFTNETPYPGFAAVLPTAGAAALILAGRREDIGGLVGRLLKLPAVVLVGRWSYSWYLWHWPVLVLGTAYSTATPWLVFLVLLSLLLAGLTYYVIEQPARYWPTLTRSPGISVTAGLLLSLGAAGFAVLAQATFAKPMIYLSNGKRLNAEAIRKDKADECLLSYDETRQPPCIYGDASGSRRAVLFGDSHAASWLPAADLAAKKAGWSLLARTKASCSSINAPLSNDRLSRPYVECSSWRDDVLSELKRLDPQLILLANNSSAPVIDATGERLNGEELENALIEAETSLVDQLLADTNATIVLIRDITSSPKDAIICLLENPLNEDACRWNRKQTAYPRGTYEEEQRVKVVDLNNVICPSGTCRAILDGRVVMRDSHHLTASFAATLASDFEPLFRLGP